MRPCTGILAPPAPEAHAELPSGFKLFLMIFVVLMVPLVMDQADVDREAVRTVGRVA